jgi:hypothetical protein
MSYLSTILVDSPSIVYKLNEPSGTALTDYSVVGDAGVISGTVAYAAAGPPIGDPAMGFTTAADFARNTNTLNFPVATVEVWAKIAATPGALSQIVGFIQANDTATSDKDLQVTTAGKLRFYVYDGGLKTIDGLTTITTNAWFHLVGVADGTNISVYVNGVDDQPTHVAAGNTYAAYTAGQPNIRLGGSQTTTNPAVWQSQTLAYFAVYPTALSAARIAAHYAAGITAAAVPTRSLLGVGT